MRSRVKRLNKVSPKEKKKILFLLHKLEAGDFSGLDIKPMKNKEGHYRLRIGNKRIIFSYKKIGGIKIIGGGFRGNIYS